MYACRHIRLMDYSTEYWAHGLDLCVYVCVRGVCLCVQYTVLGLLNQYPRTRAQRDKTLEQE
jgi:hypothetical protein